MKTIIKKTKKTKICPGCRKRKKAIYFSKDRYKASGLNTYCKKCCKQEKIKNKDKIKEQNAKYYIKNKKRINRRNREYVNKNREKHNKRVREYQKKHKRHYKKLKKIWQQKNYKHWKKTVKEYNRWDKIRRHYGLTKEEYYSKLKDQKNRCDICGSFETGRKDIKYFFVDHNHLTGKVRGLLCTQCNHRLGIAENKGNPDLLSKLEKKYLRKYGEKV